MVFQLVWIRVMKRHVLPTPGFQSIRSSRGALAWILGCRPGVLIERELVRDDSHGYASGGER
jgi:hypothetical protein